MTNKFRLDNWHNVDIAFNHTIDSYMTLLIAAKRANRFLALLNLKLTCAESEY